MSILFSAWTVLVAVVFFAIVIWVLRGDKENFDEAARIPFEESETPAMLGEEEKNHG
jgi:cbb3-type cytochrome oxidase subunit 3